jgi:hypothetical protein
LIDQKDIGDAILLLRVDDFGLTDQNTAIALERDEKRVRAIGDVIHQPGRKAEQPAVIVDGIIETASAQQITSRKDEIADGAVGELKRPARLEFSS